MNRKVSHVATLVLSVGLCLAATSFAQAAVTNWTGASSSDWNTAGNWDNGIPNSGNMLVATFGTATNTSVLIGVLSSVNSMHFTGEANYAISKISTGGLLIAGAGANITVAGGTQTIGAMIIGSYVDYSWVCNSGSLLFDGNVQLAANANSNITITFDGAGDILPKATYASYFNRALANAATNVNVVKNGAGTLKINNYYSSLGSATATGNITGNWTLNGGTVYFGSIADEAMFGANPGCYWDGATWVDPGFVANAVTFNGGTLRIGNTMTIDDDNRGITLASGGGTFNIDSGKTLTIGSAATGYANVIAGAGALNKTGDGTLVVNTANTYTGATTVSAGSLTIAHGSALGTTDAGTTVANKAALLLSGGINVAEALTITGGGATFYGALVNASGNNSYSGAITVVDGGVIGAVAGTMTIDGAIDAGANSLTFATYGGNIVVNNAMTAGTVNKNSGSNVVTLAAANDDSFVMNCNGGTVKLANANALQNCNVYVAANNGLSFAAGIGTFTIGGLHNNYGTYDMALSDGVAGITLQVGNNNLGGTYAGTLSGAGSLVKVGTANQILSNANTYTGLTTVKAGMLNIQHASALGSTDAGTIVESGARLQLQGGFTTAAEALTINGSGVANSGALQNGANDNTYAGAITLGSDAMITAYNDTTLTLNSATAIGGNFALTFGGGGNTIVSSPIATASLAKTGLGTLTLSGTSSYAGATTVETGKLVVNGSIAASSGVSLAAGTSLAGSGVVSVLSGAGSVNPGNSPGILTAESIDPSAGTDFAFELTSLGSPDYSNATASLNDVLRLTGETPSTAALTSENVVDLYFGVSSLSAGDVFRGGVYVDVAEDASGLAAFLAAVEGATYNYYVLGDGAGTHAYGGVGYYTLDEFNAANATAYEFAMSTVADAAAFAGGGTVNGGVMQFAVVPEPNALVLLAIGLLGLVAYAWRRRK